MNKLDDDDRDLLLHLLKRLRTSPNDSQDVDDEDEFEGEDGPTAKISPKVVDLLSEDDSTDEEDGEGDDLGYDGFPSIFDSCASGLHTLSKEELGTDGFPNIFGSQRSTTIIPTSHVDKNIIALDDSSSESEIPVDKAHAIPAKSGAKKHAIVKQRVQDTSKTKNQIAQTEALGKVFAEFYTNKSYIRNLNAEGKKTLIVTWPITNRNLVHALALPGLP